MMFSQILVVYCVCPCRYMVHMINECGDTVVVIAILNSGSHGGAHKTLEASS